VDTLIRIVVATGATLLLAWLGLLVYLWVARPDRAGGADAMRLLPDTVRLVRRLAADRSVGRAVRIRLGLLLAYLAFPIDLVPDFIPVIGYADDVVIVGAVMRAVIRRAGPEVVRRHWPGTPEGLGVLWRVLRLPVGAGDPYAPRAGDGPGQG
jgi:uncharacterized membrane protein YkvA (DUF1232 family)